MLKLILKLFLTAIMYSGAGRILYWEDIQHKHKIKIRWVIRWIMLSLISATTFILIAIIDDYYGGLTGMINTAKLGANLFQTSGLIFFSWFWTFDGFHIRKQDYLWKAINIVTKLYSLTFTIIAIVTNKPVTNFLFLLVNGICFTLIIIETCTILSSKYKIQKEEGRKD